MRCACRQSRSFWIDAWGAAEIADELRGQQFCWRHATERGCERFSWQRCLRHQCRQLSSRGLAQLQCARHEGARGMALCIDEKRRLPQFKMKATSCRRDERGWPLVAAPTTDACRDHYQTSGLASSFGAYACGITPMQKLARAA